MEWSMAKKQSKKKPTTDDTLKRDLKRSLVMEENKDHPCRLARIEYEKRAKLGEFSK
jgi:hypothetical protein